MTPFLVESNPPAVSPRWFQKFIVLDIDAASAQRKVDSLLPWITRYQAEASSLAVSGPAQSMPDPRAGLPVLVPAHEFARAEEEDALAGYLQAMVFCGVNSADGTMVYEGLGSADLTALAMANCREDVSNFLADNVLLLRSSKLSALEIGRLFWFNRNGHGVGFWDSVVNVAIGAALAAAARDAGTHDAMLDEAGNIHVY